MSSIEELEGEGLLSKRQLAALKVRARARANELKIKRRILVKLFQKHVKKHYDRKWDSREAFREAGRYRQQIDIMTGRVRRLVKEKSFSYDPYQGGR